MAVQTSTIKLNSSGTASFNLASGLTGGLHSAVAIYDGTSAFNGSVSQALAISVTKAPTVTALTLGTPFTNPPSALTGTSVSLTANIQFTGVGIPTGLVTFTSNGASLGTAPVLPASGGTFAATISTTALKVGSDAIAASYSGDANYIPSASTSATVTVVGSPAVTITPSSTSISTSSSGSGTVNFTVTSYGGWTGMIGFSCDPSSLPANARCVFSPGQIQVLSSTAAAPVQNLPTTLSVTINQPPQTPTASSLLWWLAGPTGLLLFVTRRRFARQAWASVSLLAGRPSAWYLGTRSRRMRQQPAEHYSRRDQQHYGVRVSRSVHRTAFIQLCNSFHRTVRRECPNWQTVHAAGIPDLSLGEVTQRSVFRKDCRPGSSRVRYATAADVS